MEKQNCWEFTQCKREAGGSNTESLGVCPAATEDRANGFNSGTNAGRLCWAVTGTFSDVKVQGTFAKKLASCEQCDFYKKVMDEEGLNLNSTNIVPKWLVALKKTEKIKKRVLLPVVLILTTILVGAVMSSSWFFSQRAKERNRHNINSVEHLFPTLIDNDVKFIDGQLQIHQKNNALQQAWLKKDRELLLDSAKPIFSTLLNKYNVTHFYFHTNDKIAFLRVHNPARHSDLISRFTLDEAAKTGLPAHGIELGPLGTFTLRVVYPWMIDGKLSGFLELGMEINHITPKIKEALGVEIFTVLHKKHTTKTGWEEGLKVMGHSGDWDMFSDSTIINQTMNTIPQQFSNLILANHEERKDTISEITHDSRIYYAGFVTLNDANGNDMGDLVVLTDVTSDKMLLKTVSIILIVNCIIIFCVIYGIFYFFLNRVERDLINSNDQVTDEIRKRLQAEKELRKEKIEREKLIQKLQNSLDEIKTLQGILPICSFCKNIRNDEGYYEKIEGYIHKHSGVDFSHTVCPTCMKKHYPEEYESIVLKKKK